MDIRDLFIAMDNGYAAAPPTAERGVITGVNGDGTVYVNCTGVGELMALADTIGSPVVGNTVVVIRTPQGPVAALRITSTASIPTDPPADPGSGAGLAQGTTYVPPIRSYSFESTYYADPIHGSQVWSGETRMRQGTDSTGLQWKANLYHVQFDPATYSAAPAERLLSSVTIQAAKLRLARGIDGTAGAQTTHLTLFDWGFWPPQAGDDWGPFTGEILPNWGTKYTGGTWTTPKPTTLTVDVTLSPGEAKWVDIPADWWPALLGSLIFHNTAGNYDVEIDVGFCLYGSTPSPEFIGPSIDDDPEQGLLRIDWSV